MVGDPLTDETIEHLVKMTEAALALSQVLHLTVPDAMRIQLKVYQANQRAIQGTLPDTVLVPEITTKH